MSALPVVPATCEGCGACCRGWGIDVWNADVGVVPLRLTKVDRFGAREMRQRQGACIALTRDGRCSIYEDRPLARRDFQRGSEECLRKLGTTATRNGNEQRVSP